ncbi:DUF551 domain-containing protein [Acidovorax sp. JG5]|uniref:DUF551 domain-containing protein n=1 Tax=Acidovorax sp. JG5 TaxID=2822718 RepID=UPI001B335EA3|nr:DUF551 domain-containing protein [Acidovorax sp. JG5]MBP3980825.1 DUF551 domain-containing protein [Acidovorax sp. JG5]
MTTEQPEALRLADELCEAIAEYPEPTALEAQAAAELRRQHARITELEAQLAQRFDAADMATAAAQGFREGAASVSAGSEPVAVVGSDFTLCWAGTGPIAPIVEKHGIKAGSPLYAHPSPTEGMGAAKEQQAEWQPIETAPKDSSYVLLAGKHRKDIASGYWLQSAYAGNGAWIWPFVHKYPTHWMPLPASPGPADGESK